MGFRYRKPLKMERGLKIFGVLGVMVSVFGLFLFYATMDARAAVLFTSVSEFEDIKYTPDELFFNAENIRFVEQPGIGTTPTKFKLKIARFGTSSDPNCKYRFDGRRYNPLPNEGGNLLDNRSPQPLIATTFVIENTLPPPGTFVEITLPIRSGEQFIWSATDFVALEFGADSCIDKAPVLFKGLQGTSSQNFFVPSRFDGNITFSCTLGDFNCATSKMAFTIEDDIPPPIPPVIDDPVNGFISIDGLIDVSGACLSSTGFETIVVVGESQEFGVQDVEIADCINGFFDLDEIFPLQLFSGTSTISAIACTDITATNCSVKSNEVTVQVLFGGEEPTPPDFTDPDFGFLGNALFSVLKFLFIPPNDVFNPLTSLIDLIKSKPPLGFFAIVENSVSSIGTTAPAFSLQGTASLSTILTPLKIGISFILWTLFAFWLFRKITSLNV